MTTGADIVRTAREYLGTPFKHQGRSKTRGIDCAGLVIGVAHELGLSDFDSADYPRQPDGHKMRAAIEGQLERVALNAMQPGDVLLIRFSQFPQHLAILTDYGIVHAHASVGRCVEHRLNDSWRARVVAAYRFPGLG
jgi:cell wall-associated NlpC family hydrolase